MVRRALRAACIRSALGHRFGQFSAPAALCARPSLLLCTEHCSTFDAKARGLTLHLEHSNRAMWRWSSKARPSAWPSHGSQFEARPPSGSHRATQLACLSPAHLACPSRLPISPAQRGRADAVFAKRWSRHAGPASRLFLSIQLMAFSKSSTEFGAKKVLPRISSSLPRPGTHAHTHTHTHTHRRGGRRLRWLARTSARGVR